MDIKTAQFIKSASGWNDLPDEDRPEVAFIGRSNVGKSSLINMLLGRRNLAKTSGHPGKTRTFNFYLVNDHFYFVDLPGYGYAKFARTERERWAKLIGRYVTERPPLRIIFHLIDSRHEPTALDQDVTALMKGSPVPYIILLTKADKLSGNERSKKKAAVEKILAQVGMEVPVILTSAEDKRGREDVLTWIDSLVTP